MSKDQRQTSTALAKRRTTSPATQPTIGLALGGGGARGLAHILILEALEEMGLRPGVIAGTSIGAIFGAAFAAGLPAGAIRAHVEELLGARFDLMRQLFAARAEPISKLLNLLPVRGALLSPEALLDIAMPKGVPKDFADLQIPLKVVATDFYAQRPVVFTQGSLHRAVGASFALPAIFSPVMIGGRAHMDGGLVNPLPFDLISDCDITIAVDVTGTSRAKSDKPPSALMALVSSSQIFQNSIVREKLRSMQPDIFIDVDVNQFHVLEFNKLAQILQAAGAAKEELKRKLDAALEAKAAGAKRPDAKRPNSSPRSGP